MQHLQSELSYVWRSARLLLCLLLLLSLLRCPLLRQLLLLLVLRLLLLSRLLLPGTGTPLTASCCRGCGCGPTLAASCRLLLLLLLWRQRRQARQLLLLLLLLPGPQQLPQAGLCPVRCVLHCIICG
jgi:hypothetical protein